MPLRVPLTRPPSGGWRARPLKVVKPAPIFSPMAQHGGIPSRTARSQIAGFGSGSGSHGAAPHHAPDLRDRRPAAEPGTATFLAADGSRALDMQTLQVEMPRCPMYRRRQRSPCPAMPAESCHQPLRRPPRRWRSQEIHPLRSSRVTAGASLVAGVALLRMAVGAAGRRSPPSRHPADPPTMMMSGSWRRGAQHMGEESGRISVDRV